MIEQTHSHDSDDCSRTAPQSPRLNRLIWLSFRPGEKGCNVTVVAGVAGWAGECGETPDRLMCD
jgi:hypothetical protein